MTKQKQIEGSETEHYVSERKKRGHEEKSMQPPLTPMIDVTFQLLLYFLLTSQFREEEGGIPGTLPQKGGPSTVKTDPRQPIHIALSPRGDAWQGAQFEVSGMPPINDPAELQRILMNKRGSGEDPPPVLIRPRGDVRWKFVVEVFNAAVHAKFTEIGFVQSG